MVFILFLALQSMVAHAQQEYYENGAPLPARINVNKIHFGIYIAPDISWMHPTSTKSDDGNYYVNSKGGKAGYMWGLMMDYYFAPNYAIATGFDINSSGGRITTAYNPNLVSTSTANSVLNTDFDYKLQYLEIPFALKLRSDPINNDGLKIYGQIGLTAAINISRKASYTVDYNDAGGNYRTLQGDNEKLTGSLAVAPIILQLNLGAGIEYPLTPKLHFYSGLFFNNGFLPNTVSPKNYDMGYAGTFTDGYVRLNSLSLRVGLFF